MKTEIYLDGNFEIIDNQTNIEYSPDKRKVLIEHNSDGNFHLIQFVFDSSHCNLGEISYVFYGREFLLSNENCHFKCEYGFMYPFSMFGFMAKEKGITIIADSHKVGFIEIEKNDKEARITFGMPIYQKGVIEFLLYEHLPELKEGIKVYQNWYIAKRGKLPVCSSFAKYIFYVRRYFFNEELCASHILQDSKVCMEEIYQDDLVKLGGVDAGLLFDFAFEKSTKIRCGNSEIIPFGEEVLSDLKKQIENIKKKHNCKFFCYFDPYIVQDGSDMDKLYRGTLPVLRQDGSVCYIWDKTQWPPCVGTESWQNVSAEFISKAAEKLCCDGIYLDEVGNGNQYCCHNEKHNHPAGFTQFKAEKEYVEKLQEKIPGKLWMCEFPLSDCEENSMDIVLSDTASLIDIYRFIFPGIKFVRINCCDRPLGDNVWEINKSFFNGEGLWIDNDINNPEWYSEKVRNVIKQNYLLLKKYQEFFTSEDVQPIFYRDESGVLANGFNHNAKTLLTFINPTEKDLCINMELEGLVLTENIYPECSVERNSAGETVLNIKSKSVGCALFEKNT